MASSSNSGLAHPPRSNPPLRFSSRAPFPWTTPSTETCVVVVSFMSGAPFSLVWSSFGTTGPPHRARRNVRPDPPRALEQTGRPSRGRVAGLGILGHVTGEAFSAPAVGEQSYVERPPIPALRELVSSVWVQQVGRDAAPYVHRRIPNGAVELACRVGSAPKVIGPLTEPLVEVLEPGTTVVGTRFVPGAFPAVARQPASEVVGLALDAEELWGRSALALGEAVGTSASPQEALAALQLHVSDRAGNGRPPDPLVSEAVRGLMPWRTADVKSLTA